MTEAKSEILAEAVPIKMIPRWKSELTRLWSIRLQLFQAAVSGLYLAWPAFQDLIPAVPYACAMIVLSLSSVVLRVVKQAEPKLEDDDDE